MKPPFPGFDKLVHAGIYAVLCGLLIRALAAPRAMFARMCILAALISFLYGISDEMHQAFVPGRSCETGDAFANLAGAVLAATLLLLARHRPLK